MNTDLARTLRITWAAVALELRLLLRDRLAIVFATVWPLVLLLALGFAAPERRWHAPIAVHVSREVTELAPWVGDALQARGRVVLVDDEGARGSETWTIELDADAATRESGGDASGPSVAVRAGGGPPGTRAWLEDRLELALVVDDPARTSRVGSPPPLRILRETATSGQEHDVVAAAWRHALASAVSWSVLVIAVNVAAGFGVERRNGTWARLRVAALPTRLLVAARIVCVPLLAVVFVVPLLVAGGCFGVPTSTLLAIATALPLASLGLGALVVCVVGWAPRSRAGQGLAWAVVLVLALLGGAMVPRPLMPPWIAAWSDVSPVAWIAVTFGDAAPAGTMLTMGVAWVCLTIFTIVMLGLAMLTVGHDDV